MISFCSILSNILLLHDEKQRIKESKVTNVCIFCMYFLPDNFFLSISVGTFLLNLSLALFKKMLQTREFHVSNFHKSLF